VRMQKSKWPLVGLSALLIAACASGTQSGSQVEKSTSAWTSAALTPELASPSRPQADRDRDADRKPAQLMTFFGVARGMTAIDVMAGGGFMTEVLSVTVGPTGKVYAQNQTANAAIGERLANNRLPNVARLDGDLSTIIPSSIDVVITVMNLHDVYNSASSALVVQALKGLHDVLKPGGVFGVVDHVGAPGADNATLHRMTKQQAIDVAEAAGFILEAESDVLAHPGDDHTRRVDDPSIRGRTDQFTLRFRKPK
jgi:predicted methyltransferase